MVDCLQPNPKTQCEKKIKKINKKTKARNLVKRNGKNKKKKKNKKKEKEGKKKRKRKERKNKLR